MRLYKFYPSHWGREALLKKRLKVTTGADINDPFELAACSIGNQHFRRPLNLWKQDMFSKVGIISFCSDWSNPVIWSHYAESHRGVCLGFDVRDELVVSVDYVDERLEVGPDELAPSACLHNEGLGFRLFRTKFHHWSYESEKRLGFSLTDPDLVREGKLLFAPCCPDMQLREVITGVDYEPTGAFSLDKQLRSDGVQISTARTAFKTFKVIEQKMRKLQKKF